MFRPKVSVCIVTYNQVSYIRKCVESILQQDADYDFEVIVGDDCSTDGTREVLNELKCRYSERLSLILHEKNVGPINNYFSVHNSAKGEYIAHLDGDDYALPGKLQVLSNYLDENTDCKIVWHRMVIINEFGETAIGMPVKPLKQTTGIDKFYLSDMAKLYGLTGCHSGSMYRRTAKKLDGYPKPTIDYFITMTFLSDGGFAAYIDEPYGVYRFFKQDQTLTRQKGGKYVGNAQLDLIPVLLEKHPTLSREFAAQILFEIFYRSYMRYPLKWQFFKLFLRCKALPRFEDLLLIWKVFNASRNKNLQKAFKNGYSGKI